MPDPDNGPEESKSHENKVDTELFDPWEQRFKFEPRSRLHGHTIERERESEPTIVY